MQTLSLIILIALAGFTADNLQPASLNEEKVTFTAENIEYCTGSSEVEMSGGAEVCFGELTVGADNVHYYSDTRILYAPVGTVEFSADAMTIDAEARDELEGYICETESYYVLRGSIDEKGKIVFRQDDESILVVPKEIIED